MIPLLLSLIFFYLYHEDADGRYTVEKAKKRVLKEVVLEEALVDAYESKDELNIIVDENTSQEKQFSIEIKGTLKTRKEIPLTLRAKVHNAFNTEGCNYFWYEGKEILHVGPVLEKSFSQGDHNISLKVLDSNGEKRTTSVMVSAYNYLSTTTLNYDPHYGNLLHTTRKVLDHQEQYILYDDGRYTKRRFHYDENSNLIKRVVEYYHHPKENRTMLFSYDDKGNNMTEQVINSHGQSIRYTEYTYDDNNTLLTVKRGTDTNDLVEDNYDYNSDYSSPIIYETVVSEDANTPENIVRLNDNGQVVYAEHHYGDFKTVNENTYEDNKLVREFRSSVSSYEERSTMVEYDSKGNAIKQEERSKNDFSGLCHYMTETQFTKQGLLKSDKSTLLEGNCGYIDEVERVYTHNDEGEVMNVKAKFGEDKEANFDTMVIKKEYLNEIEF